MSAAELEKKLTELKKDLFQLRLQHATNQLDNPVQHQRSEEATLPESRPSSVSSSSLRRRKGGTRIMTENRTSSRKTRVGLVVSR